MQKWEYKFVDPSLTEAAANKLGDEGWELVGFHPYTAAAIFKRPK